MQDQITQAQVFSRLKEQYGDRETVARNARYVIRSFVAWGVLEDSNDKGCYGQCKPMKISEPNLTILLYEAALYADKEGKVALGLLKNTPAFFPFQLLVLTGDYISQQRNTIDVVRYGLDDELLKLKTHIKKGRASMAIGTVNSSSSWKNIDFTNEQDTSNYDRIRQEVRQIVNDEITRIKNAPGLQTFD